MIKMVFSKYLAGGSLEESAARLAVLGLPALEVTVRSGEAVDPVRVADELPSLCARLASAGSSVGMISTRITSAADPCAEEILRTAASLGIRWYRLGDFKYKGFGTLRRQREEVRAALRDLAVMNREIGITGLFHNHSNRCFGAVPADLDYALDDIPPDEIGVYFDPVHAVIEGGSAGWLMALDLLAERIAALGIKDFYWLDGKEGQAGARRHSVRLCEFGEGNVPWAEIVRILHKIHFNGPVSFYGGGARAAGDEIEPLENLLNRIAQESRRLDELFAACEVGNEIRS